LPPGEQEKKKKKNKFELNVCNEKGGLNTEGAPMIFFAKLLISFLARDRKKLGQGC